MPQTEMSLDCRTDPSKLHLRLSHVVVVLGIALALRLLVLWTVVTRYPPQWFFTRGMEMGLIAKSLLAGRGLSSPFGGMTGPTAFVAPVYPIMVAAVFKVFGDASLASAIFIMSAQIVLNLVTIWLIMHVARQLFSQGAATIAGLIWGCSLPLIWMPTICWETSLSCCLLMGLIALVLRYREMDRVGPIHWMRLGGLCGFAALVNPALLPSLLAIALWLVVGTWKKAALWPLLSALTFLLVFSPWPIRNANVFHAFIPLRTTVGFELWMGNRPGATGFLDESLFPMFNTAELADYRSRGEVDYSAHKAGLAKAYIDSHPAEFVRMSTRRAVRFWSGTGTQNGSMLFAAHALVTTLFGFAGIGLMLRSRRFATAALFILPLALFPLPYIITHAEFRYRLIIDPLLVITAGFAITELVGMAARIGNRASVLPLAMNEPSHVAAKATVWRST